VDYDVPQEAIQALDVALKHGASQNPNCQSFARAFFFDDKEKIKPLGNGAEVGLHCSRGFAISNVRMFEICTDFGCRQPALPVCLGECMRTCLQRRFNLALSAAVLPGYA
jgi:hypothetical protein